jgi:RND family efflux transporter MFP subunit
VRWGAIVLALAVGAGAFWKLHALGMAPRRERDAELQSDARSFDPRPLVETVKPRRGQSSVDLHLPADIAPMQATALYARAGGYLKSLHADVGDRVTAGMPLAEIDTPEVDAQIVQAKASADLARATVAKSKVDLDLASATLKRFAGFAESGGVTAQQLDERRFAVEQAKSTLAAAEAAVVVAEADVKRLETLQAFGRVEAPIDGVVTERGYDVGALVGSASAKPLFRIEKVDVLRVYVDVPQAHAAAAKVGTPAFVTVRNWAGREFAGTITRTAGVLDASTRTLRCQIDVANADGALLSGMFGEVRLPLAAVRPPMLLPSSAPQVGAAGTLVWVVDGGRAHAKKVELGRDFGSEIEITDGLGDDDVVVKNPGERISDGIEVRVAAAKAPEAKAPAK